MIVECIRHHVITYRAVTVSERIHERCQDAQGNPTLFLTTNLVRFIQSTGDFFLCFAHLKQACVLLHRRLVYMQFLVFMYIKFTFRLIYIRILFYNVTPHVIPSVARDLQQTAHI